MPWNEIAITAPKKYLYRLIKATKGYKLEITDYISVWSEDLDQDTIKSRSAELGSVIVLETPSDIDELFNLISPCLAAPQKCQVTGEEARIEYTIDLDGLAAQEWYFQCKKLPVAQSQQIISSLVTDLLGVIAQLKTSIAKGNSQASQLQYHIWNLNRLCEKGAYQPHRYQELYYAAINRDRAISSSQAYSSDLPGMRSSDIPSSPPVNIQSGSWANAHISESQHNVPLSEDIDADTTIVGPPAAPLAGQPPSSSEPPSSGAFSQALAEFSREPTKEERMEKLERQLAGPKRKRRRF